MEPLKFSLIQGIAGFLSNFLHDLDAEAVIAGGMGDDALEIFNEN